jgi:putative membrane protein
MRSLFIGVATATLIATGAYAQSPAPTPAKFVEQAGASDKFEIESAYVMKTSKNPQVAQLADKMMLDHKKSTAMVATAAKADGLTPKPAALTLKQRTDLTALKAVPAGKTKDDLYIKQQKAAHDDALALMQGYSADGTARHLKMAAGKITPVVQSHVSMLASM